MEVRLAEKFKKMREFLNSNPPMEERKQMKKRWDAEMAKVVKGFPSPAMKSISTSH